MKLIYDCIHGYIQHSSTAIKIIDTPIFQRLRNIKQLGLASYVFPTGSHSRFEHSLGVSYLSKQLITNIKHNQPELEITDHDIDLIAISGLVHDLGHATASHAFDKYFIPALGIKGPLTKHENRSIWLLQHIVDNHKIGLTNEDVNKISNMINPPEHLRNHFMYQIVANAKSGIDTDRIDYILRDNHHLGFPFRYDYTRLFQQIRVINNEICFPEKEVLNLFELLEIRYKLHNQVFCHPAVTNVECMVLDILKLMNEGIDLRTWFDSPDDFAKFTDNVLTYLDYSDDPKLLPAKHLYNKLKERKLYRHIGDFDSLTGFDDAICLGNYHVIDLFINFGKDSQNPFNHIKFYKTNEPNKSFICNLEDYTMILPKMYQLKKTRIIRKC